VALIAGENEFAAGTCQLKDLASGAQQQVALEPDAASVVRAVEQLVAQDP